MAHALSGTTGVRSPSTVTIGAPEGTRHTPRRHTTDQLSYLLTMESDTEAKVKALALMPLMVDLTGEKPRALLEAVAKIEASLSDEQKQAAKRMQASWVTGPTPLSIEARQGIPAVQKMLKTLEAEEKTSP